MSGLVYIISAPSGSGKSTLTNQLLSAVGNLQFSISYTTRPPRGSEQNGREYFFIGKDEFTRMLAEDAFLEHACVFGDYYGTAYSFLRQAEAQGNDLVLDIDVQGAAQVQRRLPDKAVGIFVLPPSRSELEARLRRRTGAEKLVESAQRQRSDQEREQIIQKRLRAAALEIENFSSFRYILVNDQLEQSIDRLKAIVLAERFTRSKGPLSEEDRRMLGVAESCLLPNVRGQVQQILDSFAASAPR
jgi:guanylate kinase